MPAVRPGSVNALDCGEGEKRAKEIAELYNEAKQHDIRGRSTMNKKQLASALGR